MTPIRNGRPMAPVSRSFPTARAVNMKGASTKMSGSIPAEGGTLTKISDHEFEDTSPRWSPDGRRIVFLGKTQRRQFPKLFMWRHRMAAPLQSRRFRISI